MPDFDPAMQGWLEEFLRRHDAMAGTVHVAVGADLGLAAAYNIPGPVLDRVRHVARGKGMAGEAQVTGRPVQTCNIQTDTSGHINPMAKLVGGAAAVALPVLGDGGEVRAVVGISFAEERPIDGATEAGLMAAAATLP